jgi:hypothetical protein
MLIAELQRKLDIAKAFIEEITRASGKYPYLNNTIIIQDAYKTLKEIDDE